MFNFSKLHLHVLSTMMDMTWHIAKILLILPASLVVLRRGITFFISLSWRENISNVSGPSVCRILVSCRNSLGFSEMFLNGPNETQFYCKYIQIPWFFYLFYFFTVFYNVPAHCFSTQNSTCKVEGKLFGWKTWTWLDESPFTFNNK